MIGIPMPIAGEASPKAFVTAAARWMDKPDGAAPMAWLNPQLGKHERVSAVEICDSLPKTLVGKLAHGTGRGREAQRRTPDKPKRAGA